MCPILIYRRIEAFYLSDKHISRCLFPITWQVGLIGSLFVLKLYLSPLAHSTWKDVPSQSAEMLLRYCWDVLLSIHVRKSFSFNMLDALLRLLRCFFN
jgi:hypothetical protein